MTSGELSIQKSAIRKAPPYAAVREIRLTPCNLFTLVVVWRSTLLFFGKQVYMKAVAMDCMKYAKSNDSRIAVDG